MRKRYVIHYELLSNGQQLQMSVFGWVAVLRVIRWLSHRSEVRVWEVTRG